MKKISLLLLTALFSLGVWAAAPQAVVSFDKMKMSEDGGKTFGEALAVAGSFELGSPLASLTVAGDKQTYDVHETTQTPDGAWVYRCTTKENETVTITYNAKTKTVQVSTPVGVSLFLVSGIK